MPFDRSTAQKPKCSKIFTELCFHKRPIAIAFGIAATHLSLLPFGIFTPVLETLQASVFVSLTISLAAHYVYTR